MKSIKSEFYPYGVQYYRAPTPLPGEWEMDLAQISRQGYTHIQFRPQWRWHERIRGKYRWDDLDCLFGLAQSNNLRVILKPMLETAPDWVFTEINGSRIGFNGQPISPIAHAAFYVGGWWPCFDNPQVVSTASAFVQALVERYKSHPSLWFYDAWNEPRSRPLGQCQCDHSKNSYRFWLKERFSSIEALNDAYGKAWTSFSTINPPASHSDYAELHLWRQWAACSVASQIEFVNRAIKEIDRDARVLVHVGCSSVVQDAACDTSDDILNARYADCYGASFPVSFHPATPIEENDPLYQSAWMRRVDVNYWIHEFYTNAAEWHLPPTNNVLARQIWGAIAAGANGFTFWQYRSERFGEESNGWGMRNIDGTSTDRSKLCDRIASVLKKYGKALVATRPVKFQAALLYHRNNDLLMRIEEMKSDLPDIASIKGTWNYSYKIALKAIHAIYRQAGYDLEFVIPGDDLSGIKLLHVTATELIEPNTADWLREFVAQGGTLIVEYPFACRETNTWVTPQRPAYGLDALLGCREGERVVCAADQSWATFENNVRLHASHWRTELIPTTGEVTGRWKDGTAAGVRNRFGLGMVYTFAVNNGLSWSKTFDSNVTAFYRHLLSRIGLEVSDSGNTETLHVIERRGEKQSFKFLFNTGAATGYKLTGSYEICDADGAEKKADELLLPAGGTAVILINNDEKCL